ncbi:transposase [Nocardia sp. NPDC050718]|uniref:transposase n=1 Tax=Nocardia sp. NPDC050718 TaxID=3155788 RepID=UPI0033F268F3
MPRTRLASSGHSVSGCGRAGSGRCGRQPPAAENTKIAVEPGLRYAGLIDADTELVVALGVPLSGNRNDWRAWTESGAADACRNAVVIADGGYQCTGLIIAHRRSPVVELPEWKQAHNKSHHKVRGGVEHAFVRMKTLKILRDCRLSGDGVGVAMAGVATLANLAHTC